VKNGRRFTAQNIQKLSLHIIGKVMIPHIVFRFILPRLMDSFFNISNDEYYLKNIIVTGFLTLWITAAGILAINNK
jgi:hypothetical protein